MSSGWRFWVNIGIFKIICNKDFCRSIKARPKSIPITSAYSKKPQTIINQRPKYKNKTVPLHIHNAAYIYRKRKTHQTREKIYIYIFFKQLFTPFYYITSKSRLRRHATLGQALAGRQLDAKKGFFFCAALLPLIQILTQILCYL